jgi:hypothetical protein
VRRRITAGSIASGWGRWSTSDQSRAEAEALIYQFQDHIDELFDAAPETVRARDVFAHLPAAGLLPVNEPSARGFSISRFFEGLKLRPVGGAISGSPSFTAHTVIEASRVRGLWAAALHCPPLDIGSDEVIRLYQVRENLQAAASATNVQSYVIFARGAVPDHGAAHLDVSRWGYATFS